MQDGDLSGLPRGWILLLEQEGVNCAETSIQMYAQKTPLVCVKVLIFSTMTRLLDVLEDHLSWRGMAILRLDGRTAAAERGELVIYSTLS